MSDENTTAGAESTEQNRASRIVVGVDGSAGSLAALDWGVREAQMRGVAVQAVMAWQQPVVHGGAHPWSLGEDPAAATQDELAEAADAEVGRLSNEAPAALDVEVSYEAIEGHPAEVLVTTAADAALLVVGSHGHGGFAGALIGSVSQHVVSHARGAVVVVREPRAEPTPDEA